MAEDGGRRKTQLTVYFLPRQHMISHSTQLIGKQSIDSEREKIMHAALYCRAELTLWIKVKDREKKSLDQSWKIILEPEARLSLMYISTGYISVMILRCIIPGARPFQTFLAVIQTLLPLSARILIF